MSAKAVRNYYINSCIGTLITRIYEHRFLQIFYEPQSPPRFRRGCREQNIYSRKHIIRNSLIRNYYINSCIGTRMTQIYERRFLQIFLNRKVRQDFAEGAESKISIQGST